jgi:uncharacterized protein (TIGR03083 family)
MKHLETINFISLLRKIDHLLIKLLTSLEPEEWNRKTVAKKWTVKDVAAHLLDTNLRGLSYSRDRYFGENSLVVNSYEELVDFLNRLNLLWTDAAKRISPEVLIDLLKHTGPQYIDHLESLKHDADAIFPVAWAGHDISPNWFHIAREYTEKFLHQQQIRDAVGKPGILTGELYKPFLDTLLQALPVTLSKSIQPNHTIICLHIVNELDHRWFIEYINNSWEFTHTYEAATTTVTLEANTAWKLFSKSIRPAEANNSIQISGNKELGEKVLQMVSFMA